LPIADHYAMNQPQIFPKAGFLLANVQL